MSGGAGRQGGGTMVKESAQGGRDDRTLCHRRRGTGLARSGTDRRLTSDSLALRLGKTVPEWQPAAATAATDSAAANNTNTVYHGAICETPLALLSRPDTPRYDTNGCRDICRCISISVLYGCFIEYYFVLALTTSRYFNTLNTYVSEY